MKVTIDGNEVRLLARNGDGLVLRMIEDQGVEEVRLDVKLGKMLHGGRLPSIEFSKRDVILRHTGNRIEKIG